MPHSSRTNGTRSNESLIEILGFLFLKNKEFEEVREMFEKTINNNNLFKNFNITRTNKTINEKVNSFYDNGETNQMFHAFMAGYESCKSG